MTIASMIGEVNMYSAGVAVAFAAGATVVSSMLVARYQSGKKRDQDFEIAKITLENNRLVNEHAKNVEREVALGKVASGRDIEIKRIESGMIDVKSVQPSDD